MYQHGVGTAVTRVRMKGLLQLPSFHAKSHVLEIHKHEKHFQVSHTQEGVSQGGSFSKGLFSNNRIKYRWRVGEKERATFPVLAKEKMEERLRISLVLHFPGMEESSSLEV
jgi:hypothetical protein